VLAVLGSALLFGSTGTAQALGPDAATPYGVGAVRIAIGALGLWAIARRRPRWSQVRPYGRLVGLGGVSVAVYQPGFFVGTERLGVALATIVALGSGPVFAGLIEWSAGERPTKRWAGSTALAIGGGALVVSSGASGVHLDAVGLVGSLAAGLGYASYAVVTKRLIAGGVHSTVASAWQFSIGALVLVPLLVRQPLGWLATPTGAAMALHLGLLCTGVAYLLYGWGLRLIDTATATTLTLAEPVTAACLAVILLDERLRWFGWMGAGIVLIGLVSIGRAVRSSAVAPIATDAVAPLA
jgi:DME family drug/metabolite transporter